MLVKSSMYSLYPRKYANQDEDGKTEIVDVLLYCGFHTNLFSEIAFFSGHLR
jgi:hypothetical protein